MTVNESITSLRLLIRLTIADAQSTDFHGNLRKNYRPSANYGNKDVIFQEVGFKTPR